MQTMYSLINTNNAVLTKHCGSVDLFLHNLKVRRNSRAKVLYNTISRKDVPIDASSSPTKVVGDLEEYATENMHECPSKFFIRANINYEGKTNSTIERQKADVNKIYWFAREIKTVDEQFLSTKPLARSMRLDTTNRGQSIRFSPIPVTTMPLWVRNSCRPIDEHGTFFYFDVATAEFANLLLHVNKKKYKEIYFDYDLYDWIHSQIISHPTKYSRIQIKQISMALICGATFKAVMSILKISEDKSKVIVSKFWNSIPDVYDFLEDIFLKTKLVGNTSVQLMDDCVSDYVIDQFQYNDIAKRKIYASFIRDSFAFRFSNLMKSLFDKTNRKLCFAWVDSCLIPILKSSEHRQILKDLKKHYNFPLKIKYKISTSWGEASNSLENKTLIIN